MAKFFIDRPIFATVIALIIMIAGGLAMWQLPIAIYPNIAPPVVTIVATYPGASAKSTEDSVTQVIEQNMKALDGLLYMSATSESNGRSTITLTFDNSMNPDIAQVQVQNKLQLAMPLLPLTVQQQGVSVTKSRFSFMEVLAFYSTDGSMSRNDIADYIATNVLDPMSRVPGVGNVRLLGAPYAMRVWLDPHKLESYRLGVDEVIGAIRAQNAQMTVGQLGATPSVPGQQLNFAIVARERMQTPEQFRNVIIRSNPDGSVLKLADIAHVELGAETYEILSRYNGQPSSGIAVSLATGANALTTAENVDQALKQLEPYFPHGLKAVVAFDSTPFVRASIHEVKKTLIEAVVLVFLVMLLFLQNVRATLIPTIAVPVVLLGTFGILAVLGYSINMLTMFAMVLAIGLLVDDAIVVVENVERLMSEEGLSPREATRKSMDQITGALIGIGLVLAAVFVPMAFMGGATGVIYRQFSATIVSAMALSVVVAIVLTPALCATLLKPLPPETEWHTSGLFGWFNRNLKRGTERYRTIVRRMLGRPGRWMAVFGVLVVIAVLLFARLPTAFLPLEDQGELFAQLIAPVGATQARTMKSMQQMEEYFLKGEKDSVKAVIAVQGFSFGGSGQNTGIAFVALKDWEERKRPDQGAGAIARRAFMGLMGIKDAMVFAFAPPSISELGTATGYSFYLKDLSGRGHDALVAARNQLLGMAMANRRLANVRPNGMDDNPQLRLNVDVQKAGSLGLSIDSINTTLSTAWGGQYIDDFLDRGRVKHVYVQGDAPFRMNPEDFKVWTVKSGNGNMVPFSAFASSRWDYGAPRLERYNGVPALEIDGEAAPGVSTGQAMAEIERMVAQLPQGFGIEWTAVSYQERQASAQTPLLYTLSLLMVFLCLAALYESWSIPTAVMLTAPLGILGAALACTVHGMERDVYFQVAMLTTVGLASKNAILIVAFAKGNLERGAGLIEATMQAVRDRLRPILMTSMAFGLGVLPLAIASGAGSAAQRDIGTGVLGGMLAGTALGIFFIPLFFVVVERVFLHRNDEPTEPQAPSPGAGATAVEGQSHG